MLTLIQYPPAFGLTSLSPFCMKVWTYLRLCGLGFEVENRMLASGTPFGKLPVLRDGDKEIADSDDILFYLEVTYRKGLNSSVPALQLAEHHALKHLFEDHLYFANYYFRVVWDEGWAVMGPAIAAMLPLKLGAVTPQALLRRQGLAQLNDQGIGRFSADELTQIVGKSVDAISAYLGKNDFFGGEVPRQIDATAYAFLAGILLTPVESPLKKLVKGKSNLVDYHLRMLKRVS